MAYRPASPPPTAEASRASARRLLVLSATLALLLGGCATRVPAPAGDEIPDFPARRPDTTTQRCDLRPFDLATGSGADAGPAIRACIAAAAPGEVIAFPPGRFRIDSQVVVDRPLWLTSGDLEPGDARCAVGDPRCATFVAGESFFPRDGFFTAARGAQGVVVDHLIFDGNRAARQAAMPPGVCAAEAGNRYGFNVGFFRCRDCWFLNSVSQHALCGTALEVSATNVAFSRFVDNGTHRNFLWADGLTALECPGKVVYDNYFEGNTDIDLVVGTGPCAVVGNTIVHRPDFAQSAFSAISIFTFANHRQPHAGTRVAKNHIDCGEHAGCGAGLYVGNEAWAHPKNPPRTAEGPVFIDDNLIVGAPTGIIIASGRDIRLRRNRIVGSGGRFHTSCGGRDFPIASRSAASTITSTGEAFDYPVLDWLYCIPNFVH